MSSTSKTHDDRNGVGERRSHRRGRAEDLRAALRVVDGDPEEDRRERREDPSEVVATRATL